MIHGVLNVYKEAGFTSHDVVAKLRGILKQKKIGHTGTLDPDAVGVLPVCLGKGTRLCDMLTDESKTYEAVLLLGQSTDTQDTSGKVLETAEPETDPEKIRSCITGFEGEYMQIPPMYSALKINGKKLYELAREGIEIERKPRKVTSVLTLQHRLNKIEILEIAPPRVRMAVTCSKGTYIRTLCHDIGEALGCHGCMEHLTRTRVGRFDISESKTLSEIEEIVRNGGLDEILTPVDEMFSDSPYITVRPEADALAFNGNPLKETSLSFEARPDRTQRIRLYSSTGIFVGTYQYDEERKIWKPEKMFLERP